MATRISPEDKPLFWTAVGLTVAVCALAMVAWGQSYEWDLAGLSAYQLFPLFGLLAFSIMWAQYMVGAAKRYLHKPEAIQPYFDTTGWLVLVCILLHPGLLIFQRFRDGYGLPPGNYLTYVAPTQKWIMLLGSLSLLIFLSYELKHWFTHKNWWKYIVLLNDAAIIAIFVHGLGLGQQLNSGWYQTIWYFYGLLLLPVLVYKYYTALTARRAKSTL